MKHEALIEAISMLDDKLLDEARQPFRRRGAIPAAIKLCGAAAACAAAVGAFLLIPRGRGADILVFGENPAANPIAVATAGMGIARAYTLEFADIPVSIALPEKTVVSISAGELFFTANGEADARAETPLEINGGASLIWSVPLTDVSEEYTLSLQSGNNCRVLRLAFDEKTQKWTIRDYSEV